MYYISSSYTYSHVVPYPNQPLRCTSYRSHKTTNGWLIVSPETKGWCVLSNKEYIVFREIAMKSSFGITNEFGIEEQNDFVMALLQCGLVKPVQNSFVNKREENLSQEHFFLTLLLSAHCNLACRYCYFGMTPHVRPQKLDMKVARDAIRHAFEMPQKHLTIDFGEIAVSFDLFKELVIFIETLKHKKPDKIIKLAIQTNGTNLRKPILDFLEQHNVFVGISIDGPSELHDQVRIFPSGKGSHSYAESGLREIIKRRIPHIALCTISSANVKFPAEVVDYFLQLGVSQFVFKPIIKRGNALNEWPSIGVSASEYIEFLSSVINYAITHKIWNALDFSLTQTLFRLMHDPRGWVQRCPGNQCSAGQNMLVLNPYGNFFPCPRLTNVQQNDLNLGGTFSDAIQAGRHLRDNFAPTYWPRCTDCIWSAYCEGPCRFSGLLHEIQSPDDDFTCFVQSHIYQLLIEKLIPATNTFKTVDEAVPGQYNLIQRDFFISSLNNK